MSEKNFKILSRSSPNFAVSQQTQTGATDPLNDPEISTGRRIYQ
jgi:hypothetical protein